MKVSIVDKTIIELYKRIQNERKIASREISIEDIEVKHKNEIRGLIIAENFKKNGQAFDFDIINDQQIIDYLDVLYKKGKAQQKYFHYTDLNGLLGIFGNYIKKEKNLTEEGYVSRCTIRASQLRFLNDSQEYLNGQKKYIQYYSRTFTKLIDSYLQLQSNLNKNSGPSKLFKPLKNISIIGNAETKSKKIDDSNQDIFSISFCGKGDLLSQWKYYGKNSGIAIEFNLENSFYCLGNLKKDARLDESLKDLPMIAPLKIAYSEKDKKRMFIRSCFTIGNDGEPIIQNPAKEIFIPFCKNKDFMEEDESRLIFFLGDNIYVNEIDPPLIDYVVSDNKIKPFIPVTLIKKQNNKIGSENNIIKSLTVGPGVNQNLIYNALIHIFDANKFSFECEKSGKHECKSGVIIKKSNIPFRG